MLNLQQGELLRRLVTRESFVGGVVIRALLEDSGYSVKSDFGEGIQADADWDLATDREGLQS